MKRVNCLLTLLLALGLAMTGCAAKAPAAEPQPAAEPAPAAEPESAPEAPSSEPAQQLVAPETDAPETAQEGQGKTLVVYFSATGITKGVAEKIAAITDADLYEILAAVPYTAEELDYTIPDNRSKREQNDKNARPDIGSEPVDISGYSTVFIGFPIWWGEEPRILDTFVEGQDFSGKTVIPFCTSAESGIGRSGPNMEAIAGAGTWLDGARHEGDISEEELRSWIEGLLG